MPTRGRRRNALTNVSRIQESSKHMNWIRSEVIQENLRLDLFFQKEVSDYLTHIYFDVNHLSTIRDNQYLEYKS